MIRDFDTNDTETLVAIWRRASALAHPFLPPAFIEAEAENLRSVYLKFARTWVIEVEGRVVGFAAVVENALAGLFLDPALHGKGHGRALVDAAVAQTGPLSVEVFEQNAIGRRFYAAYGFEGSDVSVHEPSGQRVLHLRMIGAT
ncbi:GNAT family N-acetyltransferase [uncultured Tateyamaria sp.]|uniref:GNAT family N-acetyltransferase n=1 Tax=uncultured Tateyamaria sp. TaxID=455651 RepID=UPI002628540B|nr:GNAT family N-acetyltransferase [uncultured Tateyamaria sp.]